MAVTAMNESKPPEPPPERTPPERVADTMRVGTTLLCPHCARRAEEETFTRIGSRPEYARQTLPVYRCPFKDCRLHFALRPGS
jgi:hypothetical protein